MRKKRIRTNNKKRFNKMFAWIPAVVLMVAILGLTGCGQKKDDQQGKATPAVSLYDLNKDMCQAAEFPKMKNASDTDSDGEDSFGYLSDMDYAKVEHFSLSYAAEDGNTEEVAVIQVKDSKDVKEAEETLKEHLESRIKLFTQYEPKKVQELENGEVFTKGNYAVLIVHKDKQKVIDTFNKKTDG